jgi:hypothetical protein
VRRWRRVAFATVVLTFIPFLKTLGMFELSDASDEGSDRWTNNRFERNLLGLQKCEIRVQVQSVALDGVPCQTSRGLKRQPFPCSWIL